MLVAPFENYPTATLVQFTLKSCKILKCDMQILSFMVPHFLLKMVSADICILQKCAENCRFTYISAEFGTFPIFMHSTSAAELYLQISVQKM